VLPRDLSSRSEVPRLKAEGLVWLEPAPVRAWPFPGGAFRSLLSYVGDGFEPAATPLFRLPFSSKLYIYLSTAPPCARECTSRGVPSPTALDRIRRPYPSGSNRRHRSSSGFLTLSTTCSARNHAGLVSSPLRSWGSPEPDSLARTFRSDRGVPPGFPLHGFLLTRDEHVLRALPSCASAHSAAGTLSGHDASLAGRCTVSIAGESVYPKVASQGHQPS